MVVVDVGGDGRVRNKGPAEVALAERAVRIVKGAAIERRGEVGEGLDHLGRLGHGADSALAAFAVRGLANGADLDREIGWHATVIDVLQQPWRGLFDRVADTRVLMTVGNGELIYHADAGAQRH